MFETTRFEAERRLLASVVVAVGLSAFGAMMIFVAPGILEEVDIQALLEQVPPAFVAAFDLEQMGTLEGFLAIELYQFMWLLGIGAYVAYSAAGTIAGDEETGRLDTLLAAPMSRTRLLVEKYLALLTPILLVNLVVFVVVYAAAFVINDPLAPVDLVMVHALSIPYFCCCGAIGMLGSVAAPRRIYAEGIAAGSVIGAFLVQTVVTGTDLNWLGAIAPMRYYDPLVILTTGTYDLAGAGILGGGTVGLLAASVLVFREADIQ
jgi:ABC-2 type transport system permease protein